MRLTLALLLCSCAHQDAVAFRVLDTRAEPDDVLLDACDLWSLDCYEVDDPDGAITLLLSDRGVLLEDGAIVNGLTTHERTCNPIVWSVGHDLTLAHELGHALGWLRDIDKVGNVMCDLRMNEECGSTAAGTTEKQRQRVTRGAGRLALCVGGVRP